MLLSPGNKKKIASLGAQLLSIFGRSKEQVNRRHLHVAPSR